MNKTIKLTENEFNQLIKESVLNILNEWYDESYDDSFEINDLDYADAIQDEMTDRYEREVLGYNIDEPIEDFEIDEPF